MTSPAGFHILIVDDDDGFRESLTARLRRKGHEVTATGSPLEGLRLAQEGEFSLALVDIKMPEMDGLELLSRIKVARPILEVIILTGHATVETAIEAMKLGAYDYMTKPFEPLKLEVIIEKAHQKYQLARHAAALEGQVARLSEQLKERFSFQSIVGRSRPMQELYDRIQAVARTRSTVMILGESGTGKELVARAVHYSGPDAARPFVPVNCAALPHELIESELFGYRKGSFTSAASDSPGLFRAADGGTLFLDEITETAPDMQAKLLRVLQEHAIRPVGSTKEVQVDVRIITSSNRDMAEAVAQGKLREDLFFRLSVAPLRLPPLRERLDDVPLLCQHFLAQIRKRNNLEIDSLDKPVIEALMRYRWPGNVRELENVLEAAATFAKNKRITLGDLPAHITKDLAPAPSGALPFEGVVTIREAERLLVLRAMKLHKGNKSHVARALGMSRKQLYVKLAQYGLHEPSS